MMRFTNRCFRASVRSDYRYGSERQVQVCKQTTDLRLQRAFSRMGTTTVRARDHGASDAKSAIEDMLRGDAVPKGGSTDVIAARIPVGLAQRVRDEARRRGLTISEVVEEYITGSVQRVRSSAAVDARPWTAVGYRLSRALNALQSGDLDGAEANVADAKRLVTAELMALRDGYDADLDAVDGRADDWSGER
jgi:hypothetical protein